MRAGFTGTRDGMTIRQGWALSDWFHYPKTGGAPRVPTHLYHGCCVGADAEFQTQMIRCRVGGTDKRQWAEIHALPSNLKGMTDEGTLAMADVVHDAEPPLVRNRRIVDFATVLLACPKGEEESRSGTWATVRAARSAKRWVVIIYPDGTVVEENWPND